MRSDRPFLARFSDGTTAASRDAEVVLTERGLEISPAADSSTPTVWPYGALASATPLTRHCHDALVTYRHQPGATLFVADPAFPAALANAAPHLTARATRMRHARPWILGAIGVGIVALVVASFQLNPSRAVASMLPQPTRAALGRQVIAAMTARYRVCTAESGRQAVDALVARLTRNLEDQRTFSVVVVDWGLVNAFAAPGEQIVLTRGLIAKAGGPDEVAGVLAHEMGHGLALHPEAGIIRAVGMSAALELLLGGSGGTLANAGLLLTQLSHTRDAEREADRQALAILKESSVSQQGIIDFFGRVERADAAGGTLDLLRSHPQVAERKKHAESQASYPATPSLTPAQWQALRNICGK